VNSEEAASGVDDYSPALENADAENEREQQLVLLEQRPTDVAVDAVGKVLVESLAAFRQLVALLADDYRLATVQATAFHHRLQFSPRANPGRSHNITVIFTVQEN